MRLPHLLGRVALRHGLLQSQLQLQCRGSVDPLLPLRVEAGPRQLNAPHLVFERGSLETGVGLGIEVEGADFPQDIAGGILIAESKGAARHRRAFGTIHLGHLLDEEYLELSKKNALDTEIPMTLFFRWLKEKSYPKLFRAGAFALECGKDTNRIHIQFYLELKQGRTWSWYEKQFGVMATCFQKVRDAPGAWRYCTGQDDEKDGVLELWSFGEPVLHGSSESKADLKQCVAWIVDGYHPTMILREHPYAYCVHRARIWALWNDLQQLEKRGKLEGPV